MAVRAANSCSIFRSLSPPLLVSRRCCLCHCSTLQFCRYPKLGCRRLAMFPSQSHLFNYGGIRSRSLQCLVDTVMEELQAMRKRKRVSAASNSGLISDEELLEDKLVNRSLQKGLLLEFKKDSDRVLLAIAQRPDGKKNWMVSDQNGVTSSIKPQQVTYIIPGIDGFEQEDIADFVQKAQDNLDPALLEFAWVELLEKNHSVTPEELAEMIFGSAEALESYSAHLLLSQDEIYFTVQGTKGSRSIYRPRRTEQVEELKRRKLAKEAAEKELQEFVELLTSAKLLPSRDKPPKSSWMGEEKIRSKIESLESYAIDDWKSDEQRKMAGTIFKAMGLAKTASSAVSLLIDIGYFPLHVNLDLLKSRIHTDHSEEIIMAAESLLSDSSDPDECVDLANKPALQYNARLKDLVAELNDNLPGVTFLLANVYDLVMELIKNYDKILVVATQYNLYNVVAKKL